MFGPSCGVVLELRRIISNQKWANTCTALYRSWIFYHHGHILAEQVAYFKALGSETSKFSQSKRTCGKKKEKCLVKTFIEEGTS